MSVPAVVVCQLLRRQRWDVGNISHTMPAPRPANVARMTTTPAVQVVGSASIWVRGQVAGPRRVAKVLHAGRSAVYLDLDGSCLAVLAGRAVQVPCGVRTALPVLPDVGPGDEVVVVDGSVVMPGCEVVVATLVDTTVPVLTPAAAAWGAAQLADQALRSVRAALPATALERLAAGDPRSVAALLGLGAGLTPLGDDVLCGWLATAVASGHPALDALRREVALAAAARTTTLSATLLTCASRGEAVPEFQSLISGMARESSPTVQQAAELLLGVGETSGAGLLLGTRLALEAAR